MSTTWAGGSTRQWRRLRLFVLNRDRWICQLCGESIDPALRGDGPNPHPMSAQVHHVRGKKYGDDPKFLKAAHRLCNLRVGEVFFPNDDPLGHLSPVPRISPEMPVEVRSELIWAPETLNAHEWLRPFLAVPDDASPPLYMSPPPADAVGSYGAGAIKWIEQTQRITLRWWQSLAIVRQLEHREDGSLCHRVIVETCPRRAGKSVRLRGLALWRMEHADLFGETQTIVHTGSDVAICREVQRGSWRWAEEVAGWTVLRGSGKESIETPDGDRWLVRSQLAVYGYDVCLGLVDEGWNVSPDTVSDGLEPATLERKSPQLHLTSTAHRRATSLMKQRIKDALTTDDVEVLFLLWGAPPGSDPADPEVWRAASPHWSEDRRSMITSKYLAAWAGEADPQADDPDPMAGFTSQYLNVWQLKASPKTRGESAVTEEEWAALTADAPLRAPDSAAIESWFSEGVSLALAWKGDQVVVSVTDHGSLAEAVAAMRESGFKGMPTVGSSLRKDPALRGLSSRPGEGRVGAAVQELQRVIGEDDFRHDGGAHLTDQVLAIRTLPGADGPRMVSTGRADAVKAAVWALARCRVSEPKPMIISGRRVPD